MVKIIQNYALHEQIGEGQYGKVYRGVDTRSGKEVAAKVINVKRFKDNPKLQECTLNEIDVLNKIQSPHIVHFIQILKTINNFYFFYEFCNGGTLDQEIKRNGKLPQQKIIQYLQQLLQAFKILTANNIMHRDLKPSNILIHNGIIKLGDFGFCKSLQNQRDLAQTMLGSPIYMAPQVLRGQIYTIKADIWSLGVVVFEMAFGFCPFEQSSIARLINLLQNQTLVLNKQINPISQQLQQFLRRCLVKDHFKRIGWDQLFSFEFKANKSKLPISIPCQRVLSEYNRSTKRESDVCEKENKMMVGGQTKIFKKKSNKFDEQMIQEETHHKLAQFVKVIDKLINQNTFPQITGVIALKYYNILQRQHNKLGTRYLKQKLQLTEIIVQIENLLETDRFMSDESILKMVKASGQQKSIQGISKILQIANNPPAFEFIQQNIEKMFVSANLIKITYV